MDRVRLIEIEKLSAHPQNPRITFREDVVEGIKRQLVESKEFPYEHSILVRPLNGGFQIVCGHQRWEASRRAGLKTIPCWVREMDDEAAFMQLVLANAQGELSPLEIGIHALSAIPLATGGKGKKGGLSEYAAKIGKTKQYISELREAAEVYEAVKPSTQADGLTERAKHLASIHKADRKAWPAMVSAMLKQEWSVSDTGHWVEKVGEFEILDRWEAEFLSFDSVVRRFLEGKEFSPRTVTRLCALADSVLAMIDDHGGTISDKVREEFLAWLKDNAGGKSWDPRQIERKQKEIEQEFEEDEKSRSSAWILGDWKDHVGEIQDGTIHLLLTDPPYGLDFQSDFKLDRREERRHKRIKGDDPVEAIENLRQMLKAFTSKLTEDGHLLCFCNWTNEPAIRNVIAEAGLTVRGSLIWEKNNTGMGDPTKTFAPKHERILHAVKGSPTLYTREPDVLHADRVQSDDHPTEKPVSLLERLICATTVTGQLVADPYAGVASTLVAAKKSGRKFWGCEIDEDYHKRGDDRLKTEK